MNLDVSLVFAGTSITGPAPFGILSLAAQLERAGANVHVADFDGIDISDRSISSVFRERTARLIGLTAMTSPSLARVHALAHGLRRKFPNAIMVMGGVHPTIFPVEVLEDVPVDAVAIGEGDITIVELATGIAAGKSLAECSGLVVRQNGLPHRTSSSTTVADLESLAPPAWHLADLNRHQYVYLVESYGCPFRCTFCYTHMHGRFRTRSPSTVANDIECLVTRHGIRFFKLFDDLPFGGNRKKMLEFCKILEDRRLAVRWSSISHLQMLDDELIQSMHQAGCRRISLSLESGSPRILEMLDKRNRVEDYLRIFKMLRRHDIITGVSIMLGLPGETLDDIAQTVRVAEGMRATEYFVHYYKPYPGTALYTRALERGFAPPKNMLEWARYSDFATCTTNVSDVPIEELKRARRAILSLNDRSKNLRIMAGIACFLVYHNPWHESLRLMRTLIPRRRRS